MQIVTKNYKYIALVGVLAAVMAMISLIYGQLNQKDLSSTVGSMKTENSANVPDSPGPGLKAPGMDTESRREMFKEWVKNQEVFDGPADAAQELTFKLKLPKTPALGKPSGIYVEKDEVKEDRVVTVHYGNPGAGIEGISVSANKFPEKIDFQSWVQQAESDKKNDILKANNTPFLVEVNGFQGWAWEPGYNVIGENKAPKYGFVQWQEDDGVVYNVTGTVGPDGTSVKELMEIANTMSE